MWERKGGICTCLPFQRPLNPQECISTIITFPLFSFIFHLLSLLGDTEGETQRGKQRWITILSDTTTKGQVEVSNNQQLQILLPFQHISSFPFFNVIIHTNIYISLLKGLIYIIHIEQSILKKRKKGYILYFLYSFSIFSFLSSS